MLTWPSDISSCRYHRRTKTYPNIIYSTKNILNHIYTSFMISGSGGGYGGDDKVVYWKCEVGQVLQENLAIPMQNQSREKALITAAQNVSANVKMKILSKKRNKSLFIFRVFPIQCVLLWSIFRFPVSLSGLVYLLLHWVFTHHKRRRIIRVFRKNQTIECN